MGVKNETDWVEFKIDSSVPVILCEKGNYLIPTQKNYPDWIRQAYVKYKDTGSTSYPSLTDEFARIDADGGLRNRAEIPIQIIRYQKKGVIVER